MMNRHMEGALLSVETGECRQGLAGFLPECGNISCSNEPDLLPAGERGVNREDRKGYSYNMLNSEAGRCMNCGCLAVNPSDMATALLASDAVIRTNLRTLGAQELLTSHTRISDTLLKGELILEIQIPWDAAGTISGYEKFRLRKSIDFAVVALAYRYVLDDGVITDARMMLGAVAPVPMRRKKAEAYLIGRKPSGETALGAAKLALEGALPLSGNAYKIDVAETLVRRSLDWSGKDE